MSAPIKYVYGFAEGSRDMADLLGGKGAGLAEMTRMGLPVPPGFTVSTEACRAYLRTGQEPPELEEQVATALARLEETMGRTLGEAGDPLLVSVRSGAKFSMPGMMETILDIGLNDHSVTGLAKVSGNERFAWDSYRRLVQMFGRTVMGIDGDHFEEAIAAHKEQRGVATDHDLDTEDFVALTEEFKEIVLRETGEEFPQEPKVQMHRAIMAVFNSWNGERAHIYRMREHISEDLGTAVNVQVMVFGNKGDDSGTGVAFTRDPATGDQGVYGDYLPDAQGEDVVAGVRDALPLIELKTLDPDAYDTLMSHLHTLEDHYRDMCDVEFTVERGKLWILQTRIGKRTAEAAFCVARDLRDEGMINAAEALNRVNGTALTRLMFPRFDTNSDVPLAHGVAASPGAAVGAVVFSSAEAVKWAGEGKHVILVRRETTPDDLPGMIAAEAVLTSRGGKTSHAAVVARGMGKVCVCGAEALNVDIEGKKFTTAEGVVVSEGDVISVDGTAGSVHLGSLPLTASIVGEALESGTSTGRLTDAVLEALTEADQVRRLEVRANADTPEDAVRARALGAQGIGLCRTEHMFLGERRELVETMILARDDAEARTEALAALLPMQREDFVGILTAMDGLPVTIRLIDPPLHEFLPDRQELAVRLARTENPDPRDLELLAAVERMHEQNPMLGLRGVRLGLAVPGLMAMQCRAIAEAVAQRLADGGTPRAEIMIPLVGTVEELKLARAEAERVLAEVTEETGATLDCPIGTMIELPRAALTAGKIVGAADFFSFGTNDLTQTTWGLSRDDAEGSFFPLYMDHGIFSVSPFESIDQEGVGQLVEMAVASARAVKPGFHTGVCGEHGGDPESIHFFHHAGLDYVSCSPFRIPAARLEAGRAALADDTSKSDSR